MLSNSPLIILEKNSDEAFIWIIQQLTRAGMEVNRTFDLREARLTHAECPCPHHGTETCNCQMNVILVYQHGQPPVSLLLHGFQETTWLYLVDTPEQPIRPERVTVLRKALTPPVPETEK